MNLNTPDETKVTGNGWDNPVPGMTDPSNAEHNKKNRRVEVKVFPLGRISGMSVTVEVPMSTRELIEKEVSKLPVTLQRWVYDFARFLRQKAEGVPFNGLRLSESALARDWNTPEEDAAWASL